MAGQWETIHLVVQARMGLFLPDGPGRIRYSWRVRDMALLLFQAILGPFWLLWNVLHVVRDSRETFHYTTAYLWLPYGIVAFWFGCLLSVTVADPPNDEEIKALGAAFSGGLVVLLCSNHDGILRAPNPDGVVEERALSTIFRDLHTALFHNEQMGGVPIPFPQGIGELVTCTREPQVQEMDEFLMNLEAQNREHELPHPPPLWPRGRRRLSTSFQLLSFLPLSCLALSVLSLPFPPFVYGIDLADFAHMGLSSYFRFHLAIHCLLAPIHFANCEHVLGLLSLYFLPVSRTYPNVRRLWFEFLGVQVRWVGLPSLLISLMLLIMAPFGSVHQWFLWGFAALTGILGVFVGNRRATVNQDYEQGALVDGTFKWTVPLFQRQLSPFTVCVLCAGMVFKQQLPQVPYSSYFE